MSSQFTNEQLCELIQQGRTDLIYQLWLQVEKFIRSLAEQYVNQNEQDPELVDDMCQESFIALHTLAMNYRADKNALFLTYLKAAIRTTFRSVMLSGRGAKEKDPLNHYDSLYKVIGENPDGSEIKLLDTLKDEAGEDELREIENADYRESQNKFLRECIERFSTDDIGKAILTEMLNSNCGYRDAIQNLYGLDALTNKDHVIRLRRRKDFAVTQIRRKSRKQKTELMRKYSLLENAANCHGLRDYTLHGYRAHQFTSGVEHIVVEKNS